jgi:3-phenylpropionate/trans-cinnamate dioxygenase ferredoxin reductase subunit
VDAMNDPRGFMVGKRLIEAGKSPAPDLIADPATDLKALLKA